MSSPMLVLVAVSGRSLRLDVHAGVRVDAVQQALLSFTSVPLTDQLVMYNGARLDPNRTLGSYGLPMADPAMAEESPVFLYCRSYLKPGARIPDCEALPEIVASVPAPLSASALQMQHPLQGSPSPLVRGLPQCELQFQHDLAVAKAFWDASQLRVQRCRQLLSEQEVQARAADAARANVEVHFNHISAAHQTFLNKFSAQHASHAELLGSFESDLAHLARIQLHQGLQSRSSWRTLEDLTPVAKMRQWGDHCRRSHEHFGIKVQELGALLHALKQDVEALLLQTPTVDLDQLGSELSRAEGAADELSLVVQALSKDLRAARELVEQAVSDLADPSALGGRVLDASSAMQSIAEAHVSQLLPQACALDGRTAQFCTRCADAKAAMTQDVVTQLQRISGQQSRIRDLKSKLGAFTEVLTRQEVAFAELKMANRIPTSYRMLLAECMRRQAWQDLFAQQAARLEEHMARLRTKELHRRAAFLQQVERYLPNEAVAKAGLMAEPPTCTLGVAGLAPGDSPLLPVSAVELQWLPIRVTPASKSFMGALAAAAPPSAAELAAEMAYKPQATTSLEMENARLKSELGSHIAAACMRDLSSSEAVSPSGPAARPAASTAAVAGGSGDAQPQQQGAGGAGSRAVGGLLAASAEEAVESLKRAVKLKDDLLDKLQSEVRSLSAHCAAQAERVSVLEAQGGVYEAQLEGLQAQHAQALQLAELAAQQQVQMQLMQLQEAAQQQQGAGAGTASAAAAAAVHPQQHHRRSPPPLPPLPPGMGGSSPPPPSSPPAPQQTPQQQQQQQQREGPHLLSPQPLILGPIALAALSTCRPGSAGPPTLRSTPPLPSPSVGSLPPQAQHSQILMRGVGPEAGAGAVDTSGAGGMEVRRPLTMFSSAPLRVAPVMQQRQQPAVPPPSPQPQQAGAFAESQQQLSHPQAVPQQQDEDPHGAPKRLDSTSNEFGLIGGTFSMHDSMVAGAMDEGMGVVGPGGGPGGMVAASPPDRGASSGLQGGSGYGEEQVLGTRGSQDAGAAAAGAATAYGSLPFASSLPRYGASGIPPSMGGAGGGGAGGQGQQGAGAAGTAVGQAMPNAVLDSVMRAAGDEPEPLPWAHLRQQQQQQQAAGAVRAKGAGAAIRAPQQQQHQQHKGDVSSMEPPSASATVAAPTAPAAAGKLQKSSTGPAAAAAAAATQGSGVPKEHEEALIAATSPAGGGEHGEGAGATAGATAGPTATQQPLVQAQEVQPPATDSAASSAGAAAADAAPRHAVGEPPAPPPPDDGGEDEDAPDLDEIMADIMPDEGDGGGPGQLQASRRSGDFLYASHDDQ